jgi:hypothetical protein
MARGEERRSSRVRKGVERRRELVKEAVISRVGRGQRQARTGKDLFKITI